MMKNNPGEVYRILTMPDYSIKSINENSATRKTDWSKQHEAIFAKLSKRSFTVSSLAKSLTFADLSKQLPNDLDYPNKKWKFDKNSPWVNDLDQNEQNALVIGENLQVKSAKTKGVSNLNLKRY